MKKIFLDTNIFIDILTNRQVGDLKEKLSALDPESIHMSALSLHIACYVLKAKPRSKLYANIKAFAERINILPISAHAPVVALGINFDDYEDILQYLTAAECCDIILTRDTKDFTKLQRLIPSNVAICHNLD